MATADHLQDFRIATYPCRVHCGQDALARLPAEVARQGAKRVFVISGRSVATKTDLIDRIRNLLGDTFAGSFDRMGKDSPIEDVIAAADEARAANADLLIAVGAGSVIQAVRVVAIALAEKEPLVELATKYPEDGSPAISPKLMARKLPIINVVTVGTSAQNRAGSPLKSSEYGRRLEYFDPKTRPVALFWDHDALRTAPRSMVRASAAAIYWRAVMHLGFTKVTRLTELNRRQVYEIMDSVIRSLDEEDDIGARVDLCIATFLQNREVDDGSFRAAHWVMRFNYAFSAGIFNLHEHVSQAEGNSVLVGTALRRLGYRDPQEIANMARILGVWTGKDPIEEAPFRAADYLEKVFADLGLPTRVGQLGLPKSSVDGIMANALNNFNSDPKQEFKKEPELLREILLEAW